MGIRRNGVTDVTATGNLSCCYITTIFLFVWNTFFIFHWKIIILLLSYSLLSYCCDWCPTFQVCNLNSLDMLFMCIRNCCIKSSKLNSVCHILCICDHNLIMRQVKLHFKVELKTSLRFILVGYLEIVYVGFEWPYIQITYEGFQDFVILPCVSPQS